MTDDTELRDQAILFARRRGASLAELGRRYRISRQRVAQIFEKAERIAREGPTPADELSARLRNAIEAAGCEPTPATVRKHFTYTALKRVPNIGVGSIRELNEWLIQHGQQPITDTKATQ